MRVLEYIRVILKYRLEHLFPKQILKNLGFFRTVFHIETVTGPLPFRVKSALEELGPVFIKIGQLLSTRQDILGPSFINELKLLQDSVKPVDFKLIDPVLKNLPINVTINKNEEPSVGSVAQIYYGKLSTGEDVAVKIIKPGVKKIIEDDFLFLKKSSHLLNLFKHFRKIKLPKIIEVLHESVQKELNLTLEKENIERFRNQMRKFDFVKIPKVYYASDNVLVLERMYGVPIDQKDDLLNQNIDIIKMLNQGLEVFVVQSFYYGFYHADPHPGNVWIDKDGNRIYLDFGIMGEINKQDREIVLRLLINVFNKRFHEVKELVKKSGWTNSNLDGIEEDLSVIQTSIKGKNAGQLDLNLTVSKMLEIFTKYDINIPHNMVLLIKTLIAVDGFAKYLAPSNDVIKSLIPILVKHFSKFS